jgi:hypothetical protein
MPVNWVALIVFVVLFGFITVLGLCRCALAQGRSGPAARMGTGRHPLRHGRRLVSARRRPLHRIYLHRRPGLAALALLIFNLVVAIVLTPVFNAIHPVREEDETRAEHYV